MFCSIAWLKPIFQQNANPVRVGASRLDDVLRLLILANHGPLPPFTLAVGPGLKAPKTGGSHEYVINPFIQ